MLLSLRVSNHRSLRSEQQLNLTPVYDADRPPGTDWEAVPVTGVFGANASGKSNLVEAFGYLRELVVSSDRIAEPGLGILRYPFALDVKCEREPSWFIADFTVGGIRHTYGVVLNSDEVIEEWLHWYPLKKRQIVFHRNGRSYRYGGRSSGALAAVEPLVPQNVLFISTAARAGMQDVQNAFRWFRGATAPSGRHPLALIMDQSPLEPFLQDEKNRKYAIELLKFADFGIEDISVEEISFDQWPASERRAWKQAQALFGRSPEFKQLSNLTPPPRQQVWFTMRSSTSTARLRFEDQSSGTRTFLRHLPEVVSTLANGSVLLVDELESNLHPLLAEQVIKLFQDPETNRRRAQLLFTTHNTSTLASNGEILKRDQVWFVEKSAENGESTLYPLSAFKPRVEENTERRYLHGSYGAIPFVDEERARTALAALLSVDGGAVE